jgi:predicted metal-dependent peptidase
MMDRMQKARAKMLIKHPFFATLLVSTPWVMTKDVETAATDMTTLYFNPDFMESLDDEEILFVLAHEVMHMALEHGLRQQARNHVVWNIACDYALNLVLKESGFKIWSKALCSDAFKDKSADQIYDIINQAKQKQQGGGGGKSGGVGQPGGEHHSPMLGDLKDDPKNVDPAQQAKVKRGIQQKVAAAACQARLAGKLSGSLERLVGEILDPKVPWSHVLRDYMTRVTKDDEVWNKRNRRFANVYLPARHSEKMGEIVLIGDTSGSISNEEICKYMTEAGAIAEDVHPERIRIIWADAQVKGEQVFEDGELIVPKPVGGGGTDMRKPLKKAEKYDPECVILFTDGYTPWPDVEPDFPLIVCCTTDVAVPVGLDVRI